MADRFPHVPHGDPSTGAPEHDVQAETDAALVAAIERAHTALRTVSERGLVELGSGTSAGQLQMLEWLDQVGESRLTDLAAALGVAPSTATRLCDGLAARDLIVRRRRGQDRRVLQIHLTNRGRALMHAVHERESSDRRYALSPIAQEERVHLVTALSKIADGAERAAPAARTTSATKPLGRRGFPGASS